MSRRKLLEVGAGPTKKGTGRGGARPGGGRPKGSKDKSRIALEAMTEAALKDASGKTIPQEIAVMTPLAVIMRAMQLQCVVENWSAAAMFANMAAPYCHAKLAPKLVDPDDEDANTIIVKGGLPKNGT